VPQPLGVIHVFIAGKPAEDGLAQESGKRVPGVLARASISKPIARRRAQPTARHRVRDMRADLRLT
jgi:hypothetical protein